MFSAATVCYRPSSARILQCSYLQASSRRFKQTSSQETSKASAISSKLAETDEDKFRPRPLSKPLGLPQKPSADPITWAQKRDDLLSHEKVLERRKHIVKEATKGYFQDYNALKHNEGKTWIGPTSLIHEDKAFYYPDITGVTLTPQEAVHTTTVFKGHVSIVAMLSTTRSEEHVRSFTEPAVAAHLSNPLFRYVQINLQDNPLKGFLVSLFLSSIRARIPQELQSTYIMSRFNVEYLREPMGMINKHVGYVYLVDQNCKIRWAGCGFAVDGEANSLKTCTGVLLKRLAANGGEEGKVVGSTASTTIPTASS
ncbi:hypothetical protein M422DRAFT_69567, partial [Sphaerobolus stellatus SS14]